MRGILAFLDILGYQSFLENNSAEDTARSVLNLITKLPSEIKQEFADQWKSHAENHITDYNSVSDALEPIIFSDTIVLALPYKNPKKEWQDAAVAYITMFTTHLTARLFCKGLPTRGVIHEGDFLIEGTCLAGKCVVEAYRLNSLLDFSGLVFSSTLSERIFDPTANPAIFDKSCLGNFFVDYLSPLKGGLEKRLWHLNWPSYFPATDLTACTKDVDRFVLNAFWAHSKDCALEADTKASATSKLIRRLLIASESSLSLGGR